MNTMLQRLLAGFFNYVVKQEALKGYRSYIAGFVSIAGAACIVLDMVVAGEYSEEKAGVAFAAFVLGQKIIGDAGKADALAAATTQAAVVTMVATKQAAEKVAVATEVAADKVADATEEAAK